MTFFTATCDAQLVPDEGKAPKVIHLLPLGLVQGRDGRSWVLSNPQELVARFQENKIDLAIDYEHQANEPQRAASGPIPAAGWIKQLELRDDGIWGHVSWTKTAANMIEAKEYRYISPVFKYHDATKDIVALKGAGLVHTPNLHLTALAREETTMNTDQPELSKIAAALGLKGDSSVDSIVSAINSMATPDPARFVPIEAVKDLMADRSSKVAAMRESDVEITVQKAMDEGYITPGMRDWATALCRQNPESFQKFTTSSAPVYAHLFEKRDWGKPENTSTGKASEAELAICNQLDIDPENLLNT